jgi:hypothetical protein
MNRKTNEPDLRGGGMKESKKEKQMNLPTRPKPKKPITASEQEAEHTTPKKTQPSKAQKEAPTTQGAMRAMESRTIK